MDRREAESLLLESAYDVPVKERNRFWYYGKKLITWLYKHGFKIVKKHERGK